MIIDPFECQDESDADLTVAWMAFYWKAKGMKDIQHDREFMD